jgi:hypothetical protein
MKQIDRFLLNILGIYKSLSSASKWPCLVVLLEKLGNFLKSWVYVIHVVETKKFPVRMDMRKKKLYAK